MVLFRDYAADDVKNNGGTESSGGSDNGNPSNGKTNSETGRETSVQTNVQTSKDRRRERRRDINGETRGQTSGEISDGGGGGETSGETRGENSQGGGGGETSGERSFEPGTKVGRDTYVRSDGTLAVFTDEAAVESMFRGEAGLEGECWLVGHEIVNRKLGVSIKRSYVQGRFRKPLAS